MSSRHKKHVARAPSGPGKTRDRPLVRYSAARHPYDESLQQEEKTSKPLVLLPRVEGPSSSAWYRPDIDGAALEAILAEFKLREPRPAYKPPVLEPVLRCWNPLNTPPTTDARVVQARKALQIQGVKVKPEPQVSRSGREGWRGRAFSLKSGGVMVPWKGRLVYAAIKIADADASVSFLMVSPLTLGFRDSQGNWRQYSPHLLVMKSGVPTLITCHWEEEAASREQYWAEVGKACQSLKLGFEVLTERYLERQPTQSNMKRVWRARRTPRPEGARLAEIQDAATASQHTISSLAEAVSVDEDVILTLILHRHLFVDIDEDFGSAVVLCGPRHAPLA